MLCVKVAAALLLLISAATAARVRRDALPLSELHASRPQADIHGYVYMNEQGSLHIGHGKAGHSSNNGEPEHCPEQGTTTIPAAQWGYNPCAQECMAPPPSPAQHSPIAFARKLDNS